MLAGGGWGHGVGMSQWGADGQAKAGRDYEQILSTYYRGTAMGSAPETLIQRVRVLVADGLASASVGERGRRVRRGRKALPIPQADDHDQARPEARRRPGRQAARARGAGDDPRREGQVPLVRRQGIPGRPAGRERLRPHPARQRRRPRGVPARGRPGRDAEGLAARSARGAGGGGAYVRRSATSSAGGRSTSTRTGAARSTTASSPRRQARRRPSRRRPDRSSPTTGPRRRPSTSPRAEAGRSARSTHSVSTSRTSVSVDDPGTPRRRTTRGRLSC